MSFGPNVTYASPTVLLNHQQHHYAHTQTTSHADQLNNKQMTMSATLTATPTSGNEMPGYPRVLSDPPRSLNCNGYPGLTEYGGNSINTTANNQSATNTSSASQMQPPSSATQSPSRQTPTSRPNSHMSYHMSPTQQAQSPSASTTPVNNNQHYPTSGMITPTSHHQHDGTSQHEWNQNAWNGNPQSNEMFNQSDRINLNTRLKTMILNKSDKEQSAQQQTGHFLSYSHQHLSSSEQQQQQHSSENNNAASNNSSLALSSNNNNNNNESIKEAGTGDDGGFKVNDSWKSSIIKQEQDQQSRNKDFFEHKQQLNEKNIGIDPGGGKDENSKKEESYSSENNQQQQHTYPSSEFSSGTTKIEKTSLDDKPSYAYNSAHEYQQHQSMVNSIKKEPNVEMETSSVKFEGYEKNYQNFIRYADFCDSAQQPSSVPPPPNAQYQEHHPHQKQSQYHQQDYIQSQGYYNYPYQNYPQNYHQNYQPAFMTSSQQAAYQQHHPHHPHHSSLTNFEQQIPLHTYPIPKSSSGASIKGEIAIKTEQNSHNIHPYPFLSENMNAAAAAANKDNIGHHYSRPINPINEVPTIEDSSCINNPSTKEQVSSKFTLLLLFLILNFFLMTNFENFSINRV